MASAAFQVIEDAAVAEWCRQADAASLRGTHPCWYLYYRKGELQLIQDGEEDASWTLASGETVRISWTRERVRGHVRSVGMHCPIF